MLRGFHLADFLTLCNAACGVAGVFLAMLYAVEQSIGYFYAAAAMAPAAFVFDVLDGRVARWRRQRLPPACVVPGTGWP
jgi:CDP-diacylglycerol--serine O-phosphatidyltransferase